VRQSTRVKLTFETTFETKLVSVYMELALSPLSLRLRLRLNAPQFPGILSSAPLWEALLRLRCRGGGVHGCVSPSSRSLPSRVDDGGARLQVTQGGAPQALFNFLSTSPRFLFCGS
jgi:hypothetical protein